MSIMTQAPKRIPLTGSDLFKGWLELECPVVGCKVTRRFPETIQTIKDDIESTKRRQRYLRLCHLAGRHNK